LGDRRTRGLTPRPEIRAKPHFAEGLTALRLGRWDEALARFAEASAALAESEGAIEPRMVRSWAAMADAHLQDIAAMEEQIAWFSRNARFCGDALVRSHVELRRGYALFLRGRYAEARAAIDQRLSMFGEDRPNAQRAAALLYRLLPDLYLDD